MSEPCNGGPSRRGFLKTSAGLMAGATVAPLLPERAQAQGADAELARVQGQRRVLIKGGAHLERTARVPAACRVRFLAPVVALKN